MDLRIPDKEFEAISKIYKKLGLSSITTQENKDEFIKVLKEMEFDFPDLENYISKITIIKEIK